MTRCLVALGPTIDAPVSVLEMHGATGHMDTLYEALIQRLSLLFSLCFCLCLPPAAVAPYVLYVVNAQQISCSGLQVEMT